MKTKGLIRFLALCLAVISLSMLVSGGLGIRAANKERRKDDSELQDLRSRIDEYREISAALMDRTSYEDLNKTLEEKQKKYDTETAKHRSELTAYTATNTGLEMGTAALNQAESALETGKTQYETGRKALKSSLNAFNQIYSIIEPINAQYGTIVELFFVAEDMLWGGDINSGDPYGGSVYQLERAIRKLCELIENDLPREKDSSQMTDNSGDLASVSEDSPVDNTSSGKEISEQRGQTSTDIESGGSGEMDGGVGGTGNLDQNNEQNPDEGQQPREPVNQEPENQEPENQEPENQEPENQEPENQEPENQEPENQEPENQEPENREPENQEPENQEPENREPENQEPENQEPENREPENREPESQEPENQEPENQEPENQEPENQEPENQEPKNQEPENQKPENQEPENREQLSDLPDDSKPAGDSKNDGDLSATHEDSFPELDQSGTPRSPNTGEEKDLSGRLNDAIREVIRAAEAVQEDVNTITALAESINLPPEVLQTVLGSAGVSTVDELRKVMVDAIHSSGIVLTPEQGEALEQMLQILSDADTITGSVTDQMEEIRGAAGTVDHDTDELVKNLHAALSQADYTFTEEQMIDIRTAYMANQESIEEELDSIEEERREGYNTVIQARSTAERIFGLLGQLSGAKATLEETLAAMKEVGEQIEEGEAALAEGKAQLNTAKEQQKKKAEELDNKKRDLDQQEKALKQSTELAEEQKELEEREKALRTALLSREEIRRRSQYGEELLSASEHWLAEYTDQTAERYRDRFDASLLMIVCAILAFAGALTSFGENRYRMITLLTTLLCLAFSVSAALLLQRMGRGISWSATVSAAIAAMELILMIPSMPLLHQADAPMEHGIKQSSKTGTKTARNPAQQKK